MIRRSDSIRFRQENERSPSALDKGTIRKIDNKIKILRKNDFKLSLAKLIRVSSYFLMRSSIPLLAKL